MSFVPAVIDLSNKSKNGEGSGIKAGIRGKVTPRLFLTIARSVAKDLGMIDGTPVEVLIGEQDHHGLIRIRKNEAGLAYVEDSSSRANGSLHIRLGHQPLFVARSEASQACDWRLIADGFIELKLPKWSAETGPKKVAASKVDVANKRKVNDAQIAMLSVRIEEQSQARPLIKRSVTVREVEPAKPVVKRVPAAPNPMPLNALKRHVTQSTFQKQRAQANTRALFGDPEPGRSALDQREGGK